MAKSLISNPQSPPERTRLTAGRVHLAASDGTHRYNVTVIEAGKNLNGWILPIEVLGQAIAKFSGAPCQIDHPGWFDNPSILRLAGTIEVPMLTSTGLDATLRLNNTPSGILLGQIFDAWLADKEAGLEVVPIGLSAVLWLKWRHSEEDEAWTAHEITQVESADAVLHPAAGGRVERVLNSIQPSTFNLQPPPTERNITMTPQTQVLDPPAEEQLLPAPAPAVSITSADQAISDALTNIADRLTQLEEVATSPTEPVTEPEPTPVPADEMSQRLDTLTGNVKRVIEIMARQAESSTIQDMGTAPHSDDRIHGMRTNYEQVKLAFSALVDGVRPPDNILPLTGLREFYNLMSGDYEMTGRFQPDRVMLANVNASTMAQLVANVLNKRLVHEFQQYPRWWEPFTTPQDFNSLQQIRWITLGGVGELPTVAAGSAYTELTWDDLAQRQSFIKKGGYLGLTIEAIDKDDIGRITAAPRALAQAAWLTLSKSISTIFTSNSGVGPNVYYDDSNTRALFHTSNSNLGSTAFSWSAWDATRTAMRKQTEHHSGERLGALTAPHFCLVPSDLETKALQNFASEGEPDTGDNDENPFADGDAHSARMRAARRRVIVVDLWTNTANWAAVANPQMYPTIGIGYRYGRVPELFSVADPNAGLMFSSDVMPIKVRWFYATGPMDYRGLYKHNI